MTNVSPHRQLRVFEMLKLGMPPSISTGNLSAPGMSIAGFEVGGYGLAVVSHRQHSQHFEINGYRQSLHASVPHGKVANAWMIAAKLPSLMLLNEVGQCKVNNPSLPL